MATLKPTIINGGGNTAPLILKNGDNGYKEGLRIIMSKTWSDIVLGGSGLTEQSGISNNSWFIGNNDSKFYITRGDSAGTAGGAQLKCVDNYWTFTGNISVPTLTADGINASGTSNRINFRHIDGQKCSDSDYNLYLQYHQSDYKTYFNGGTYYIKGGYYNGTSESSNYAHLLRTYASNNASHGGDYLLKCRHNVDGNDRFKLQITRTDGTVTHSTSVDHALTADTVANATKSTGMTFTGDIAYQGSKSTNTIIHFLNNTSDEWGNGVAIGGGGRTVIGGGEAASSFYDSTGTEDVILASDSGVYIRTSNDNGSNFSTFDFNSDGSFVVGNSYIWVQAGSSAGGDRNRLTTSAGMPGNMQYNVSRRGTQIYANGIAFADPYNGNNNNDSAWIRHIETTGNSGYLEIAVGDDSDNEQIYFRGYNTSNAVAWSSNIPHVNGTVAVVTGYSNGTLTLN